MAKSKEEFTVIELTQNNNNNNADKFKEEFTHTHAQHFKRLFERTLRIFRLLPRPLATTTAYWRCKERLYSFVDLNWDLKAVVLIQVSYNQYKSFRASEVRKYRTLLKAAKKKSHRKLFLTLFEIL